MLIKKKIKAKELNNGDIFYFTPNEELNDWLGEFALTAGSDMIFIVDDVEITDDDFVIYTNGGFDLNLNPDDYVYYMGHYSEILTFVESQN